MSNPGVTESLGWAALEPHLETVIDLDLNSPEDSARFQELVRAVAAAIRSGDEDSAEESKIEPKAPRFGSDIRELPRFAEALAKSKETLAKLHPESIPDWWLRERPELYMVPQDIPEEKAQS